MKSASTRGYDTERKTTIVVSSKIVNVEDIEAIGAEETEIAAQISVPHEGGWGWVVVICAFWCVLLLDGVSFTYGSMYADIKKDLSAPESLVALVNSLAIAIYFMSAPVASAFINRFGFRACSMTGSVICSSALLCSYFATTIGTLCMFYGVIAGIGYSFINMGCTLVVGFYFERLRSLALAITTSGSSVGIMTMFPVNAYLVRLAGWRITTLIHSGLFGFVYYLSMAFKPLLSLTVMKATDETTRTVTYIPSLASTAVRAPSRVGTEKLTSTRTEKLLGAVSNVHFPTAAEVVEGGATTTSHAGPSTAAASKLTIKAHAPQSGLSRRQLNQVKSIMSKSTIQDRGKPAEVVDQKPPKKKSCWARLCHWDEHIDESRPMYRDDVFYDGRIDKLSVYQKSVADVAEGGRTGLEYQMAVSRAVTTADLKENRGVFTTAFRRILVSMVDPKVLKRGSFLLLCISGFLMFVGFLVPYVFVQDRNLSEGVDAKHCTLFVSVIGFANIFGKIGLGSLACKFNALNLYRAACVAGGITSMVSNLSFNVYFQYVCCGIFGFFVGSLTSLRSVVLVDLYGLETLTNATGIILMFKGLGCLVSTPLASMLKNKFGYAVAFYVAGISLSLAGVILIPVPSLCKKENDKIELQNNKANQNLPST